MSKELTDFFAKDEIEDIARETGFVQRDSTKIDGNVFLQSLMFTGFDQEELSLNDLSGQLKEKYRIDISKQGIDQRFTDKSVAFLRLVMEKLLIKIISREPVIDILKDIKSIRIKDSTCFQLPDDMVERFQGSGGAGSKASIRIQFEFDYKTGQIYDLSLHPFNTQDQTDATATVGNINAGDLVIRDLGYVNINVLLLIASCGAFYLNRLNSASIYEEKNGEIKEVDLVEVKAHMVKFNLACIEKEIYVGKEKKIKTRVIIELMPDSQVKERIRKANKEAKKKKRTLSKEFKTRAALNIFITNLDSEQLPIDKVRSLYRLRWQIELVFKVWKSVGKIHKVKDMKTERFETILYAKLIKISMNWSILWEISKVLWKTEKIQLSPIKFFKTLKDRNYQNWLAFQTGKEQVAIFITDLYEMSPKNHKADKKKKQLSSLEIQLMFLVKNT